MFVVKPRNDKNEETIVEERKLVIELWKSGKSFREIGKIVTNRSYVGIQCIVNKYKNIEILENVHRSERTNE